MVFAISPLPIWRIKTLVDIKLIKTKNSLIIMLHDCIVFSLRATVAAQRRHPQPTAPHSGGTVKSNVDESFSLFSLGFCPWSGGHMTAVRVVTQNNRPEILETSRQSAECLLVTQDHTYKIFYSGSTKNCKGYSRGAILVETFDHTWIWVKSQGGGDS
jgi:hypothetical protein